MKLQVGIIGISRHRLLTDGDGVTTLVAFHGLLKKGKEVRDEIHSTSNHKRVSATDR